MMDCGRFERWLDEGMPEADANEASAHVSSCARCASALAAARSLDRALAESAVAAPAGFAQRVMERVARARLVGLVAWVEADALPWWVRAAAEPAAALALALAALVLWQYPALARLAEAAFRALGDPAVAAAARRMLEPRIVLDLGALSHPVVISGVALAFLPFAWWAGLAVYHWSGDPQPLRAGRR